MGRVSTLRQRIAEEAAKILATGQGGDYLHAKKKAASHLGAVEKHDWPTNREINEALSAYQQLFQQESHTIAITGLRQTALKAMLLFENFKPRLVGNVLDGTANENSEVNLHLFADTYEDVGFFLESQDIPYELADRSMRWGNGDIKNQPEYRFVANHVPVSLTVFVAHEGRERPISPLDGQPMERASIKKVQALLAVEASL
jgi:hypothetical protein